MSWNFPSQVLTQQSATGLPLEGKNPRFDRKSLVSPIFLSHRRRILQGQQISTEICYHGMFYELGFFDAIALVGFSFPPIFPF